MKEKLYIGAIVVLALIVCLFLLLFFRYTATVFSSDEPIEFSQEAWDANPYDRGGMVGNLLEKYDFSSMTKDDVVELLGEKLLSVGSKTLGYETGGGLLGDEILLFIFDESGKVVDVSIAN